MKSARLFSVLLLIVVGLCCAKPSRAETTEEMLSACRPFTQANVADGKVRIESDYDTGVCWGAFSVVQALLSARNLETKKPMLWACAPDTSTRTQLISVFVHYAESHPEKYSDIFLQSVVDAMQQAFPCRAKG
jgi:Rap1a immunity proteins